MEPKYNTFVNHIGQVVDKQEGKFYFCFPIVWIELVSNQEPFKLS